MDYEKKYKEALERARQFSEKPYLEDSKGIVDYIFPELKESEDERIINRIKKAVEEYWSDEPLDEILAWFEKQGESKSAGKMQVSEKLYEHIRNTCACIDDALSSETLADVKDYLSQANYDAQSAFDMIEKQGEQRPYGQREECSDCEFRCGDKCIGSCAMKRGEQKPTNKVEPKFKVGDWIIFNEHHNSVYQVEKIQGLRYYLRHYTGGSMSVHIDNQLIRQWTIQDAKDGDVLAYNDSKNNVWVCIFKEYVNERVYDYCTLDKESFWERGNWNYLASFSYIPATKEQRDLLFQKMKETGYEWDAEKKELKKIEQKPVELEKEEKSRLMKKCVHRAYQQGYDTGFFMATTELEHKQEWSEEDDKMINSIAVHLNATTGGFPEDRAWADKFIIWLKSLKDRVQPEQEWSEEDEKIRSSIINFIRYELNHSAYIGTAGVDSARQIEWLKSLRPQTTWKPSDEQMKALKSMIDITNRATSFDAYKSRIVESIYEQLKAL